MKLYELRACWTEKWEDSDCGSQDVCNVSTTIAISLDRSKLEPLALELRNGHGPYWSIERSNILRTIFPGYDDMRDTTYEIVDITDKFIP